MSMAHHAGQDAEQFWEAFYRGGQRWSGRPNALLVDAVAGLPAGTALDLGCGQGGDAIWLALQGWRVTGVDLSAGALAFAAEHAAAAGLGESIAWERHDLESSFPVGTFDLVSACYLHSPVPMSREPVLRAAAAAVAPGGSLLVVGHAGSPSWATPHVEVHFPTPEAVLEALHLGDGWTIRRSAAVDSATTDPDGRPATRPDNVLHVERLRTTQAVAGGHPIRAAAS